MSVSVLKNLALSAVLIEGKFTDNAVFLFDKSWILFNVRHFGIYE